MGQGRFALTRLGPGKMAKTILIADDSPFIRKMLCRFFDVQEDYDICAEATNGQEAIDLALKHRPDLIVLDFEMPVLNGLEAARELGRIMPEVPIILFTQHAFAEGVLRSEPSIDQVISKTDANTLMGYIKSLAPV